jgi:hypothetical protein
MKASLSKADVKRISARSRRKIALKRWLEKERFFVGGKIQYIYSVSFYPAYANSFKKIRAIFKTYSLNKDPDGEQWSAKPIFDSHGKSIALSRFFWLRISRQLKRLSFSKRAYLEMSGIFDFLKKRDFVGDLEKI